MSLNIIPPFFICIWFREIFENRAHGYAVKLVVSGYGSPCHTLDDEGRKARFLPYTGPLYIIIVKKAVHVETFCLFRYPGVAIE